MNLIKKFKHLTTALKAITPKKYTFLTPAILSKEIGVPQNQAKILLELASKSHLCRRAYIVKSPFNEGEKYFGPYTFKSEIPKFLDHQSYDHDDEFEVKPEYIIQVYKLYE